MANLFLSFIWQLRDLNRDLAIRLLNAGVDLLNEVLKVHSNVIELLLRFIRLLLHERQVDIMKLHTQLRESQLFIVLRLHRNKILLINLT